MGELLPARQAGRIRAGLLDYLTTTFALADPDARAALAELLGHDLDGMFKGPYLRCGMPFSPAPKRAVSPLDWQPPGFTPYAHQAAAFRRLSSAGRTATHTRDHRHPRRVGRLLQRPPERAAAWSSAVTARGQPGEGPLSAGVFASHETRRGWSR